MRRVATGAYEDNILFLASALTFEALVAALPFAKGLHALGVEIISTGGTARKLKEGGIPVIEVSQYTGFPEMLDGRVKTLHSGREYY